MLCNDWSPQESFFFFFCLIMLRPDWFPRHWVCVLWGVGISSPICFVQLFAKGIGALFCYFHQTPRDPQLFSEALLNVWWIRVVLVLSASDTWVLSTICTSMCFVFIQLSQFMGLCSCFCLWFSVFICMGCCNLWATREIISFGWNCKERGLWVFCFLLLFFFVVYVQCLVLFPRPYPIPVCVPELHLQCRLQ